jgi:hypothetical protein
VPILSPTAVTHLVVGVLWGVRGDKNILEKGKEGADKRYRRKQRRRENATRRGRRSKGKG